MRKGKGTSSRAGENTLLYLHCKLHHSGCTQTLLSALKKLLSAPKIYHLHLLCAAVQTSPEAQTPHLHYPLLCQPLGHLKTSFAVILRLAGQGTAQHHTANNFLAVALAAGCRDPQEMLPPAMSAHW